jgi:hypothetical protein
MTLVFFDGPRTVLMLDDVAGATGCAADRFSSVAEIKCLIHGGPIMYRRTWAATIEGQFPRKLARLGTGQGHLSEITRQDIGRSALILAPNDCDRLIRRPLNGRDPNPGLALSILSDT